MNRFVEIALCSSSKLSYTPLRQNLINRIPFKVVVCQVLERNFPFF